MMTTASDMSSSSSADSAGHIATTASVLAKNSFLIFSTVVFLSASNGWHTTHTPVSIPFAVAAATASARNDLL